MDATILAGLIVLVVVLSTATIFYHIWFNKVEIQKEKVVAALEILLYGIGYDDESAKRDRPQTWTETVLSWYPLSCDSYDEGRSDARSGIPHKYTGDSAPTDLINDDEDDDDDEADREEYAREQKAEDMYSELVDRLSAVGIVERDDGDEQGYEEKIPIRASVHKAIEIAREIGASFEEKIEYSLCYQYEDPLIIDVAFHFLEKTYTFGPKIPI